MIKTCYSCNYTQFMPVLSREHDKSPCTINEHMYNMLYGNNTK